MALYLNRGRMRVVQKDDKGRVTYRKTYFFGDEVDTSKMDDHRVEHLTEKGTLVTSEDDLQRRRAGLVPYPGSRLTGAASGDAPDTLDAPEEGQSEGEEGEVADDGQSDDDDEGEQVDQYTSMDYGDLQQTAKSRGLNAGGSAEDLRQRLREDDES